MMFVGQQALGDIVTSQADIHLRLGVVRISMGLEKKLHSEEPRNKASANKVIPYNNIDI